MKKVPVLLQKQNQSLIVTDKSLNIIRWTNILKLSSLILELPKLVAIRIFAKTELHLNPQNNTHTKFAFIPWKYKHLSKVLCKIFITADSL